MKKIATIVSSVALLAATVFPVLAATNSCTNSTTGPFSTDYCSINNTSNVVVNNINDARIENTLNAVANTGENSTSYNTLGGTIQTGDATLNATISNVANVNTTSVSGGPAASSNLGENEITGPFSDNRININNKQAVFVDNSNTAFVRNNVNVTANTGKNAADYNTGPASVTTGDAWLGASIGNHVNDNATSVSAGAGGTGGNAGGNFTTGPFSTDYVDIVNNASVVVNNINDLRVGNFVNALANAGVNTASYNTLGGTVVAGDASAGVRVNTEGNINTSSVSMALGGFSNMGGNEITGPYSDNRDNLLNTLGIVVNNLNNKCESHNAPKHCNPEDLGVVNYDNDVANTGDNAADFNTGGGGVSSGLAELLKTILVHLNDSLTIIQQ